MTDSSRDDVAPAVSEPEPIPEPGPEVPVIPIVGIGASAGGLEAFTQFLSSLPERSGMAFVLIQHLNPKFESHLTELLAKTAKLPVLEARDGMSVLADHVYIIPPNSYLSYRKGCLFLSPRPEGQAVPMPINFFLRSLADEAQSRAIGVILSGTGTDGTQGLAEIKAAGGITFAQDENSAKQFGMPQSAIAEGVVDYILSPEEIVRELMVIARHPYFSMSSHRDGEEGSTQGEADFRKILALLRAHSGVDFTNYRDTTLKRRIMRRMALFQHQTTSSYAKKLKDDRAEIQALFQDVLINVTRFFRDQPVFERLKELVYPEIHKGKPPGTPLRIWVAGCATGEEPYSIAISLIEFQDTQSIRPSIRIFATDISETPSLEKARMGLYPESIELDVSPERLKRFFTKEHGGYRINKDVRDLCVFARHNVAMDPPFSRMDLISCRNLLIYLSPLLQRRVLPTFHYALNPGGYLLLGNSETIGRETDLFNAVDSKLKIYSRKMTGARLPMVFSHEIQPAAAGFKPHALPSSPFDFEKAADRLLLRRFAPAGVLVNKDLDILQFRGRTSPYLEPPQGEASFNLLKMAPENLFMEIRAAVQEAGGQNRSVHRRGVKIRDNHKVKDVNLEIIPVRPPEIGENCYLVLFEEPGTDGSHPEPSPAKAAPAAPVDEGETALLRTELGAAREYLQTIREQFDAVNEELKSSNEEILSSNEELQSTNEELETAKEELQSTNEELTTMNDELRSRNVELNQLNNDLNNLISSVSVPMVMLGIDLRIRRFTPTAGKILRLKTADLGRPIGDIKTAIGTADLEQAVTEVITNVAPIGREVQDQDGRWHTLKIYPYRTSDNRIDGAVVVLLDIDEAKRAQEMLRESSEHAMGIVATVREPLIILDADQRVLSANRAFYKIFGGAPEEAEGRLLWDLGDGQWNLPALKERLQEILPKNSSFEDFEMEHLLPHRGRRIFQLNARTIRRNGDVQSGILLAIEDITESRQELLQSRNRYRMLFESSRDAILILDAGDGRILDANPEVSILTGVPIEQAIGKSMVDLGIFQDAAEGDAAIRELRSAGNVRLDYVSLLSKDGRKREVEIVGNAYVASEGSVAQCNIRDVTERRRAERDLKLFKFICDQSNDPYYLLDRGTHFLYINQSAYVRLGYTEAELRSLLLKDIDPLLGGEAYAELFDKAQAGRVPPFEGTHITKDKQVFPVEYTVTGLHFEGESFLLAVVRDLTERKRDQEALSRSEENLRHSQKVEAVGKLTGGIAHDFNNLLTAINGYSEICLSMEPSDGPLRDNLMEIRKAGERAASLTRKLLAYSRKQVLAPRIMNINDIVVDMNRMLERLIGENITLVEDLDPDPGMVKVDRGEMEQILVNLVLNARDALPDGGRIILETRRRMVSDENPEPDAYLPPDDYSVLSVIDNGTGMSEEVKSRIFDPFFTTKEVGRGTGLGLSMVQGIVAQSGGYITVDSKEGLGTTFRIFLPVAVANRVKPDDPQDASNEDAKGHETVLVVEDEDSVRTFVRKILEMQGYRVLEASNGFKALSLAEEKGELIHLLLTDVVMPGMTGKELVDRFVRMHPGIRVVFMSGYTNDNVLTQGVTESGSHFIQKPFTPENLVKTLRQALSEAGIVPTT